VQRVLRLYAERYHGFNVRHFYQIVRREHGVTLSYSFVKSGPWETFNDRWRSASRGP